MRSMERAARLLGPAPQAARGIWSRCGAARLPENRLMSKKMLVDASHPEETRVVIVDGNRVEEFDYESASRRQLKGNVYLAKVTRVEPSLQACFVEYGGNRQGFLAFSEIHPDYYQIPTADRQALIEATRASDRHAADDEVEDEQPSTAATTQSTAPAIAET